jgi:hypothetical protein
MKTTEYLRGYEDATRAAAETARGWDEEVVARSIELEAKKHVATLTAEIEARAEATREMSRLGQECDGAIVREAGRDWSAEPVWSRNISINDPLPQSAGGTWKALSEFEVIPDGPVLLYFGARQWRTADGAAAQLDTVRDYVERAGAAFAEAGDIFEAGTAHSVWEDWRFPCNVPTHWMPMPAAPENAKWTATDSGAEGGL